MSIVESQMTPLKKGRSHSDVEPETPSPSITQQPKSSRLSAEEKLISSCNLIDSDVVNLIKEQIQSNFRLILQEEIQKGNDDLFSKLNGMAKQIDNQNKELAACKQQLSRERSYTKNLEEKLLRLETYSRRDNLKFFGIPESGGETPIDCERKVIQAIHNAGLGEIQPRAFVRCHRLGTPHSSNPRPRPILVRFLHYKDKDYTLRNEKLLKQAGTPIAEDYPEEIERRRQVLTPVYWAIFNFSDNEHSYPYRSKVKLTYDHLMFNGMSITVENLHKLPSYFHPEVVATPSQQGITAFYSEASPLSNHYPCQFTMGKWTYNCVEQRYFQQKALLMGDEETAEEIMKSSNPRHQKKLGYTIKDLSKQKGAWASKCDSVMKDAVLAKFEQSDHCKNFLKGTRKTTLVEASPKDRYWGVGVHIRDRNIWNKSQWKGQNKLGNLLMELRDN